MESPSVSIAIDPVCGMEVDTSTSLLSFDYDGETYWFCSDECIVKFDAEPAPFSAAMRTIDGRAVAGDV